jgi:pimeloyl-ACP methyl ester carboxylesterase
MDLDRLLPEAVSWATMQDVAISPDGIPIQFEVEGTGRRALVFVHGWSCDRTYWRGQIDAFAHAFQVVAVDLAGHGASGMGRSSWTMSAFGGDVVAVADRLGLDDMVLVGHSMGGDVIVEAALTLGGRVAGLVWVDTYRKLAEPDANEAAEIQAFVEPFRHDFAGEVAKMVRGMFPPTADHELVEWVATDMSAAPMDVALDAMVRAVGNEGPILGSLPKLTAPVVAINPDYRPTDEVSLRRYGVTPVILTGVGHFLMLEDPDQFNQVLGEVVHEFARTTTRT